MRLSFSRVDMADIINLDDKRKQHTPVYCYTCTCGAQLFVLRPDARIECGNCEQIVSQLIWAQYFVSPQGIETGPIPESPAP